MKELLKKISKISAAPGFEQDIREFIKSILGSNEIKTDAYGNLILHKKGGGTPVIVAVPMDIPSVFVTHKEKNGFVRFVTTGIEQSKLIGLKIKFKKDICGIVFAEKKKDTENNKRENTDMFIDLGDSDKVFEAEPGMIDSGFCEIEDNITFFAAGIRGALCAAITAAKEQVKRETYFVFLAKTTNGTPSSSVLSYTKKAEELIIIDKSYANDFPGEKNTSVSLSDGVALRIMDKTIISSTELVDSLSKYKNHIKIQKEVSEEKSFAGVLQKERSGLRAVSLGIPTRYCDEICETVNINDIKTTANIITKYLNE